MVELFSVRGRISRGRFFRLTLLNALVAAGSLFTFNRFGGLSGGTPAVLVSVTVFLACAATAGALTVKRLHDINRSGWHWWLLLVPPYTFYLGVLVFIKPGCDGQNRYGMDPLNCPHRPSARRAPDSG